MFVKIVKKNGTYDVIQATKLTSVIIDDPEEVRFDICHIDGHHKTYAYLKSHGIIIYILNDEGKTIDKIITNS